MPMLTSPQTMLAVFVPHARPCSLCGDLANHKHGKHNENTVFEYENEAKHNMIYHVHLGRQA
jgi:hypothetical protein